MKTMLAIINVFLYFFCNFYNCFFVVSKPVFDYNVQLIKLTENFDEKSIDEVFYCFEQISKNDQTLFYIMQNYYQTYLPKYRDYIMNSANKLFEMDEYEKCYDLLIAKKLFFTEHSGYENLLNMCNEQIQDKNTVLYKGEIVHFFTHCLLAYPSIALSPSTPNSVNYDKDCVTISEFEEFLNSMYDNDYVLVDIDSIRDVKDGKAFKQNIYLPKGKKPLILSFDDVNYDSKKANNGMIDKLIIDSNDNLASFTKKANQSISYNNEFVLILENFIKKYPDFSFKNARAILCLTGYDGILGYRTQNGSPNQISEIEKAKKVVSKLKDLGYKFACHSYGHYHLNKIDHTKLQEEIQLFASEVESIIGKTDIFVFPYGESVISQKGESSQKHKMLINAGFNTFFGVGCKTFFGYLPYKKCDDQVLFMDRKPLDGFSLRARQKEYKDYFDCSKIYDYEYRTVPFV